MVPLYSYMIFFKYGKFWFFNIYLLKLQFKYFVHVCYFIMGRGVRKDNEVYKSYYELYSQFNFYLEDAKSLLQECKGNAKDNCMMECTMNLNVRYYKNRTKNEDYFF